MRIARRLLSTFRLGFEACTFLSHKSTFLCNGHLTVVRVIARVDRTYTRNEVLLTSFEKAELCDHIFTTCLKFLLAQ